MSAFRMPVKGSTRRTRGVPPKARDPLKTPWTATGRKRPPATAACVLELLEDAVGSSDEFKLVAIRALRRAQAVA